MRNLVGKANPWIPSSVGEELLFQLFLYHRELPLMVDSLEGLSLSLCGRGDALVDFFVGSAIMSIHMRLVKLAVDVREQEERLDEQIRSFRAKAAARFGLTHLTYAANLDDLARISLRCAEMAARSVVPPAMTRAVSPETQGRCYSCGLYFTDEDEIGKLTRTGDHVWPASLGGDTVKENMLASCDHCNSAKQHMAVWQMSWLQPEVYSEMKWATASNTISRAQKMALHTRAAFDFAHISGCTLKNAFIALGPRESVDLIDNQESIDFHNLRVHSVDSFDKIGN